jgi:hypothetical protein
MASGFPYPLPWYYMIVNIFLMFRFLKARNTNPRLKALADYRAESGLEGKIPCMFEGFGKPSAPIILPSTPAIDFEFVVPAHATGCGPILRPFPPVMKSHPELELWLKQRPTVLVNLGSHIIFDAQFAKQFATGLRTLLDRRSDIQVLWKLKTQGQTKKSMYAPGGALEIIAPELEEGRVRIEDWLPAQPSAILESGHVICMIHHGGANSYHEAIRYVHTSFQHPIIIPHQYRMQEIKSLLTTSQCWCPTNCPSRLDRYIRFRVTLRISRNRRLG